MQLVSHIASYESLENVARVITRQVAMDVFHVVMTYDNNHVHSPSHHISYPLHNLQVACKA